MSLIHFNLRLSADKGCTRGFTGIRQIADAANLEIYYGNEGHYGNDFMTTPADPEELEIVKSLLDENKYHWTLVDKLPYQMQHMAT